MIRQGISRSFKVKKRTIFRTAQDDYGKLEDRRQKEEIFFRDDQKKDFRVRNQISGCQELGVEK